MKFLILADIHGDFLKLSKIMKKERRGIPHHLLDVASPKRIFTVVQYRKLALEAINKILRSRLSANHPEQYSIPGALEGNQDHLQIAMQKLTKRRDITVDMMNNIQGISCVKPEGAFYAFPKLELNNSDNHFVAELIKETGVVVVPGTGFGQVPGTNHMRIVFLPPEDVLEKAYKKIEDFFAMYKDKFEN